MNMARWRANRLSTQIAFGLIYLGVTLMIVLSAIWTGIAVADRLVRPDPPADRRRGRSRDRQP
jgi:nitrogen fixation/metabolism regulation signal transduction histidine kinase